MLSISADITVREILIISSSAAHLCRYYSKRDPKNTFRGYDRRKVVILRTLLAPCELNWHVKNRCLYNTNYKKLPKNTECKQKSAYISYNKYDILWLLYFSAHVKYLAEGKGRTVNRSELVYLDHYNMYDQNDNVLYSRLGQIFRMEKNRLW